MESTKCLHIQTIFVLYLYESPHIYFKIHFFQILSCLKLKYWGSNHLDAHVSLFWIELENGIFTVL